jgi:peptidoglycan-associated lipoprotein
MDHGASRSLALATLVLAGLGFTTACKTAQPAAETPTTQPPAFDSRPAEKVDEATGFKEAGMPSESFGEGSSSLADKLNAQGVLRRIHFDFDRADLRSDAIQTLTENASSIKTHSGIPIRIEGHCDERGTTEYNLALGDRRARAAKEYLVSAGVPAQRLRTISYGKEKPLDPGHSESAWASNRRAEFVFVAD